MKTTTSFVETLKPEQRESRRVNSSSYYNANKDKLITKNRIKYYTNKYGYDLVQSYVKEYGDNALMKIKENSKKILEPHPFAGCNGTVESLKN